MRKYTAIDIMKLKPCYEIQQVEQLWDGREALSLAEICRLNIELADIIWVVSRILPKRAIRLFAADCAEHVLHLFEREHPADARPRECIDMARKYADGNASWEELAAARAATMTAARYVAINAARAAGWAAAGTAARAAGHESLWSAACTIAGDAASAAAYDAAKDACWAAARRTEQKWQLGRLIEYVTEAEENPSKGKKHA